MGGECRASDQPVQFLRCLHPTGLGKFHFICGSMSELLEESSTIDCSNREIANRIGEIGVSRWMRAEAEFSNRHSGPFLTKLGFECVKQQIPGEVGKNGGLQALPSEFDQRFVLPRFKFPDERWRFEFRPVVHKCLFRGDYEWSCNLLREPLGKSLRLLLGSVHQPVQLQNCTRQGQRPEQTTCS